MGFTSLYVLDKILEKKDKKKIEDNEEFTKFKSQEEELRNQQLNLEKNNFRIFGAFICLKGNEK